ncbi:uncharacterized protein LOC116431965 [Nomia melanderi]|uniref:uncharacterized protein LOC116431965 n=1 Tax=Nomia melanderi TaxID=2448451 RepID=UPI0013047948|nr:uncharacterized protein LOC116431965 [Nomia melanderi]
MFVQMNVERTMILLLCFQMAWIRGSSSEQPREKRQLYPPPLVYPLGGTFKMLIGVAVPIQIPGRTLVYGQNVQFQFSLPDNATFFTNFFENSSRRRRNVNRNERTAVYDILERELDRRNIDGRSCLKKNICEAAATPVKDDGLLGELLHLLLSPDEGGVSSMDREYLDAAAAGRRCENCSTIYPTCPDGLGILDRISTVY